MSTFATRAGTEAAPSEGYICLIKHEIFCHYKRSSDRTRLTKFLASRSQKIFRVHFITREQTCLQHLEVLAFPRKSCVHLYQFF